MKLLKITFGCALLLIEACSAKPNHLMKAQEFVSKHCIETNSTDLLIIGPLNHSCDENETVAQKAIRLHGQSYYMERSLDRLIDYLEENPESKEARSLLEQIKSVQITILKKQLEEAIQHRRDSEIFNIAKNLQYLQRRLEPHSPIASDIKNRINHSPDVVSAIQRVEGLYKKQVAPSRPSKPSAPSQRPTPSASGSKGHSH